MGMAPRCLAFAMLLLAGILVLGNLPAGISADCHDYLLPPILRKCHKSIQKVGPQILPSRACCRILQGADVPCLCKYITPPIEAEISVEKTVYVARTCGCPVHGGTKCGSKLIWSLIWCHVYNIPFITICYNISILHKYDENEWHGVNNSL